MNKLAIAIATIGATILSATHPALADGRTVNLEWLTSVDAYRDVEARFIGHIGEDPLSPGHLLAGMGKDDPADAGDVLQPKIATQYGAGVSHWAEDAVPTIADPYRHLLEFTKAGGESDPADSGDLLQSFQYKMSDKQYATMYSPIYSVILD